MNKKNISIVTIITIVALSVAPLTFLGADTTSDDCDSECGLPPSFSRETKPVWKVDPGYMQSNPGSMQGNPANIPANPGQLPVNPGTLPAYQGELTENPDNLLQDQYDGASTDGGDDGTDTNDNSDTQDTD